MFTDASQAVNDEARRALVSERRRLMLLALLRRPAVVVRHVASLRKRGLKHYLGLLIGIPLSVLSLPVGHVREEEGQGGVGYKKVGPRWQRDVRLLHQNA